MKKRVRRILSVILTAVMIFALLPVFGKPIEVKAADPQEHVHENQDTKGSDHSGWEKISTWDDLKKLGEKGGSGYLGNNIEISKRFDIESGKIVNLCLNGYSIIQNADDQTNTIIVYGTLNLYDEKDNSGKITHADGKKGYGVSNLGTFTMNGGTISGKKDTVGSGVYNSGTFTMNGGTISGNNADYGGGVYNNGTFTMEGGTISGNNARYGGGVLNYGTFTMTGGAIEGNNTDNNGGGVDNLGTFTMNGGTIEGNNADHGGGVFNAVSFTMIKGAIKDNNAIFKGSGVFSSKPFVKEGGEIDDSIESGAGSLCAVTFNANDGSDKTIIQYVNPNEDINLEPNKFSYGNYPFGCWNTKEDGTGDSYKDRATINIKGDLELYARWIEKSYDVTFKVNKGSWEDGTKDEKTITVLKYVGDKELKLNASNIPTPANPDTGYKGSWDTDPNTVNILTENKTTYTYTFEPIEYTVKFDANGGEGTMDDQSRTYDDKVTLTTNAFTLEGYTFTGWNTAADGSGTSYADKNDSNLSNTDGETVTLFAQWQANKYTVKFDANGGEGTIDDQSRTYDDKASLTANAFTFEGKTFNGWNTAVDGSGTSYADEEVNNLSSTDGDTVTLYAQWTIDTFTITWKDYNGTVLETDTDVAYGTTPTFDGEPPKRDNAGNIKYTFNGWTPEIDTVKGATTYTATYSEEEIEEPTKPTEPTEPTTPEEPTNPTTPEEPTEIETPEEPTEIETPEEPAEPEVPEITEPEPEPDSEIPEKDWLDDLRLRLRIANELGGPQTVEYSGDFALPYEIMQYLVEHTDITFIYTVTYEGVDYTITILGGKAIADSNIPWYGPLWLLANYGGDKVPEIMAGSGKYTVVEGDTLSGIAEKFNTTVEELAKKNGIKNPDYIIVGQVIVY